MEVPEFSPTVPELLRHCVSRAPEALCIVHGERRLSYRDVERESATLARGLLARGLGKGTRIALWMPNGPDWLIAWAAAARIGAWVVPLNTFYRPREVGWALHHADIQCLLTFSDFLRNDYLAMLEQAIPGLEQQEDTTLRIPTHPYLREVLAWGDANRAWCQAGPETLLQDAQSEPAIDDGFLAAVEDCVTPADALVMIYSSGSEGNPKGAVHSHGAIIRHAHNLNQFRDLDASDRLYSPMPFFWVGGLVFSLLSAMDAGACILTEDVFEPGATLEFLERERATQVLGWPHYAKAMVEHPTFSERDLSAVRAGNLYEVLPEELRPTDTELRSNSLGMTETCGPHTIDRMDVELPESLRGSFGHSVPGVTHKVVDPESGETLAAGEFGEICVRGYSLMQGLYKVEREEAFDRDGFYHTGDSGYFDADGVLFFRSRLGDLIKTGGANVTPREVEIVLEALPVVREAYVVGLPDADRGQLVAAAIVLQQGEQVTAAGLRSELKAELSAYKVPREIRFYEHEDLPFTDSGKIDKRALIEMIDSSALG
ncbi:MAG: acyl-CoA synthetase [Deltaproteobacteria bacterium]|nr:acyl-CoA synthetase [Deltaproteobacteria bacterium]